MKNIDLKKRIVELSYKHKLSHIGSCLTAVDIIDEIYETKGKDDIFILSSGHAGLALYCVLEKHGDKAEDLLNKHGVHPNRDRNIYCSTGSLGHGIGIGVGAAITGRRVHILLTDGELAEGSVYEAVNVILAYKLSNVNLYVNFNGYGAFRKTSINQVRHLLEPLRDVCKVRIYHTSPPSMPYFEGLQAHYHVLSDEEYKELQNYYAA